MQEKLIEILSNATDWMQANKIAEIGGWRSAANVGVALSQMEKGNGSVVRRKSPTVRMHNGMPATEWKLKDKAFAPEHQKTKTPAKASTDEAAPAKSVIIEGLNAQLDKLTSDIRSATQRAEAAEANRDDLKKERDGLIERNVKLRAECDELFIKLGDTEIELASAKDVKEAAIGYLVRTPGKPSKMRTKPESAHAAAMSSARVHGKAEVLALVPIGKAVRGAEWKEAA